MDIQSIYHHSNSGQIVEWHAGSREVPMALYSVIRGGSTFLSHWSIGLGTIQDRSGTLQVSNWGLDGTSNNWIVVGSWIVYYSRIRSSNIQQFWGHLEGRIRNTTEIWWSTISIGVVLQSDTSNLRRQSNIHCGIQNWLETQLVNNWSIILWILG